MMDLDCQYQNWGKHVKHISGSICKISSKLIDRRKNGPRPKSLLEGGQTGTFRRPKKQLDFERRFYHKDLLQHPQTIYQSQDLVEIFPTVYNMLIIRWEEERSQPIKNTLKNRAQTSHCTLTIDSATKTEDKGRELYITRKLLKRSFSWCIIRS